jgi:hypothetical protein
LSAPSIAHPAEAEAGQDVDRDRHQLQTGEDHHQVMRLTMISIPIAARIR